MTDTCHIVCPDCAAINRLPVARLQSAPNCGKCGTPLFSGKPLDLGDQNFQRHLERNDIPVLVDFWAQWCGPCKVMAPAFQQAAKTLEPRVRLAKVNTEQARSVEGARSGDRRGQWGRPTLCAGPRASYNRCRLAHCYRTANKVVVTARKRADTARLSPLSVAWVAVAF